MEAGTALRLHFPLNTSVSQSNRTSNPKIAFTLSSPPSRSHSSTVHSFLRPKPKRDFLADWASQNDDVVRPLPIYVGTTSLFAVLFNRAISGIAPVADAGSSQSRADLLTLGLAVTNILAGLVWLSIKPKSIAVVNPQGAECKKLFPALPDVALTELLWVWESLSEVTCCRSLVIVYESSCVLQFGFAAESSPGNGEVVSVDTDKLMQGSVYQGVVKSGTQSYLANLSLYPGKSELPFLPPNTQEGVCEFEGEGIGEHRRERSRRKNAVILQPLGDKGIAIIGGDTIRGFTTSDQAWITYIGEKLDSTLTKYVKPQTYLVT